jgi:hypothetical protein
VTALSMIRRAVAVKIVPSASTLDCARLRRWIRAYGSRRQCCSL